MKHIRTSALLEQLKRDVPENGATFGWLIDYLRARSPEVIVLFLAMVGVLPGVSLPVGVLLALFAVAMLWPKWHRALPPLLSSWRVPSPRLIRAIDRMAPLFRWGERIIRPRDTQLADSLRPIAAVAVLSLSLTLLIPVPLSNVIPSLAIALIAFASVEKDGLLLAVSLVTALVSLAVTGAMIWAAFDAALRIWS